MEGTWTGEKSNCRLDPILSDGLSDVPKNRWNFFLDFFHISANRDLTFLDVLSDLNGELFFYVFKASIVPA